MKYSLLTALALSALVMSCSSGSSDADADQEDTTAVDQSTAVVAAEEQVDKEIPEELKQVAERGRADAEKAMALPAESAERTEAILEIRAAETRLREAGYENSADAYIAGASKILKF